MSQTLLSWHSPVCVRAEIAGHAPGENGLMHGLGKSNLTKMQQNFQPSTPILSPPISPTSRWDKWKIPSFEHVSDKSTLEKVQEKKSIFEKKIEKIRVFSFWAWHPTEGLVQLKLKMV